MKWAGLMVLAIGCAGGATPRRPAPIASAPPIAQRPHVVQPYELVLRGAPALGVQRAIIASYGQVWLRLDDEPRSAPGWGHGSSTNVVVAQRSGERIRILHDDDDARLLVWIERSALATVTRREVGLQATPDAPAPVRGSVGVTIAAGTVLHVLTELGGHRLVELEHDGLYVTGVLDDRAISDAWDAAPAFEPPEVTHRVVSGAMIHAEPRAGAPVLALARAAIQVAVRSGPDDGWYEIETAGASIVTRGFVRAAEVSPDDGLHTGGTGSGHGYGSSHWLSLSLPAGVCLFDRIGGEVIGVSTIARTRLASFSDEQGWWYVLVGSTWGLLDLAAHAPGSDADPQWETCL